MVENTQSGLDQLNESAAAMDRVGEYLDTGDATEWEKMRYYTAAPAEAVAAAPWWQNMVAYGITKAVDNTFPGRNAGIQGNTSPGSFAGQNGRTYKQVGGLNAPPQTVGGMANRVSRMNPMTLGLLCLGAYVILKK